MVRCDESEESDEKETLRGRERDDWVAIESRAVLLGSMMGELRPPGLAGDEAIAVD